MRPPGPTPGVGEHRRSPHPSWAIQVPSVRPAVPPHPAVMAASDPGRLHRGPCGWEAATIAAGLCQMSATDFAYDFFLSRRGSVAAVAREVANILEREDFKVVVQDYDFASSGHFVLDIDKALKQ